MPIESYRQQQSAVRQAHLRVSVPKEVSCAVHEGTGQHSAGPHPLQICAASCGFRKDLCDVCRPFLPRRLMSLGPGVPTRESLWDLCNASLFFDPLVESPLGRFPNFRRLAWRVDAAVTCGHSTSTQHSCINLPLSRAFCRAVHGPLALQTAGASTTPHHPLVSAGFRCRATKKGHFGHTPAPHKPKI